MVRRSWSDSLLDNELVRQRVVSDKTDPILVVIVAYNLQAETR